MQINKKLQQRLLAKNIKYSNLDGMAFSIWTGATIPTYLGLYILRLNGTPEMVNLILAIQPFVVAIFTLLGASFANSYQRKKPILMPASLVVRLFILLIIFIPFLPQNYQAPSFLLLWGLMYIPWAYICLTWGPLISNIIPEERRGRFFGTRNTLTKFTTIIGTMYTGIVLANLEFRPAFISIITISFIFTLVSYYYLDKHIEPVVAEPGENKKNIRVGNARIIEFDLAKNLEVFKDPQYGYIFGLSCLAIFFFHIGYSMAIPLFTLRQVNELGFSNATVGLFANITALTALIGSYISGRLTDRCGFRYILLFSTIILIIPPLIWAFTANLPILMATIMLWGFAENAYVICYQFMVLEVSPYKERSRFVGMNTVIVNLAAGIGPLVGMLLMKIPNVSIRGTLIAVSLMMLVGSLLSYQVARKGSF
ncbi:MAG TPA: MFS transporter [Bacillota bacterium]|nr:MFS transporter [Bacillota bacterium]HOL09817.1 MFS transporter [Bacillota bacterium]HPO98751.1 MFS transporter [Bacillota bacterium]